MHINTFAESPELSAMRGTLFYTELRPYVHARLAVNRFTEGLHIHEENEARLSVEDRYFAKLDILFAQLFKNCKMRQFWKQMLMRLHDEEAVSCLSIEVLEKAYLNELVVLFERLGRFTSLLRKAFQSNVDVVDIELRLLAFFNPLLFSKRNYAHHRLYLGFRGMAELQLLEEKVTDEKSFDAYYTEFEARLNEILGWISYTERELAGFLRDFLEIVYSRIQRDGAYIAPSCLAADFSISDRLDVDIRKQHDHEKVFAEHSSNKSLQGEQASAPERRR
jgi:hypothetical protein